MLSRMSALLAPERIEKLVKAMLHPQESDTPYFHFADLSSRSGLEQSHIGEIINVLKLEGLVQHKSGLERDDGEFYGSGYALTDEGFTYRQTLEITMHVPATEQKARGSSVSNPANTKYSWQSWAKGYAAWVALLPLYLTLWAYARAFGRIPDWLTRKLLRSHGRTTAARKHNVRIPTTETIPAYMHRWWKIRRNALFNIYYHDVFRSDDDLALHDHPWWSFSIVLAGGYYEHTIAYGGVHHKKWFGPGSVLFRPHGGSAHRLQLAPRMSEFNPTVPFIHLDGRPQELPSKTIFVTGPVLRRWGFHDSEQWVDAYDWDDYNRERGRSSMKMEGYAEQLKDQGK